MCKINKFIFFQYVHNHYILYDNITLNTIINNIYLRQEPNTYNDSIIFYIIKNKQYKILELKRTIIQT